MRVAWGLEEGQEGPIPNRGVTQSSCMGMDHLDCGVGEGVGLGIHRCCSVIKSCLTVCKPMDCSMPGFLILHHLPEVAPTHAH